MTKAIDSGIIRIEGDTIHVSSIKLVQAGALLAKEGVPLEKLLKIVDDLRAESERIAGGLMELTTALHLRSLCKTHCPPPEEVPRLAELIWRLRPMVLQIVDAEVARAMNWHRTRIWAKNFQDHRADANQRLMEGNMLVSTTENVAGQQNEANTGSGVRACVRSRGLGGNIVASLRTIVGGEIHEIHPASGRNPQTGARPHGAQCEPDGAPMPW